VVQEEIVARSANGQAVSATRRTRPARRRLAAFLQKSKKRGDLSAWRRAKAVLGYIQGKKVIAMAAELDVTRGSINRWLQWYEADGIEGLVPKKPPGGTPRLTDEQMAKVATTVAAGPQAAGYNTGVWTGPMIGDWIRREFGVRYHNHHIPRLLHRLGFSVQRPRKRLARADLEKQEYWLRKRLPAIKKKPPHAEA
jgi:transposase